MLGDTDDLLLQRDQVGEAAVRHGDSLRPPRRAGGVDDVGERVVGDPGARVFGVGVAVRRPRRVAEHGRVVHPQHRGGVLAGHPAAERLQRRGVGDERGGPRVADHVGEPVPWISGVQGQVDRAGLQYPEQGHDHLDVPAEQHAHGLLPPDPGGEQCPGEPVGQPVQLGVGESPLPAHHGLGVRFAPDPRAELGQVRPARTPGPHLGADAQHAGGLVRVEHRHPADGTTRVGDELGQQGEQPAPVVAHGLLIEGVRLVTESHGDLVVGDHHHRQRVVGGVGDPHPGEL